MSILKTIGNTPLVELSSFSTNPQVKIFGKLEGLNPGGSIKDRPAYYMITKAEESGELTQGKIIVEATSGNTGIAIAMIGAAKGYRVKLFMPECVSSERKLILESFGADVVLTSAVENTDGAIRAAQELITAEPDKYYMPNQYDNQYNSLAHYETTGPEIYAQTGGNLAVFVAGMGTTGTLMGTGRYLKEKIPDIRIIGMEPVEGHTIQGLKNLTESAVPGIYHSDLLDEKIMVNDEESFTTMRMLAIKEGIFAGISSGAAVSAAVRIAKNMEKGNIVTILPDRGERYLSSSSFRSVCAKCPP